MRFVTELIGRARRQGVRAVRQLLRGVVEYRMPGHWHGTSWIDSEVWGLERVELGGHNRVGRNTTLGHDVQIGLASTIGANCHVVGPVTIGNYSQVAPGVYIYGQDHPIDRITPYGGRQLFEGRLRRNYGRGRVTIGHSVWVGCNTVILRGVTIGNGAVIGAGSVVKDDVPPYTIAVGNPAHPVRRRFDDATISKIEATEWWTNTPTELAPYEQIFHADVIAHPSVIDGFPVPLSPLRHDVAAPAPSGSRPHGPRRLGLTRGARRMGRNRT